MNTLVKKYTNLPDPVKFYLEKTLIALILDDDDLITDYSTYLTSKSGGNEYAIAKAEIDIKKALQMDLTDQADLDDLLNEVGTILDLIDSYDAYNYAHIDSTTFTEGTRLDSILAILGRCVVRADAQQSIKTSRFTSLVSDLALISDDLDNITPVDYYDEYYKTIYTLFIKNIVEGGLSPTDYDDLNDIAYDNTDGSVANATAFSLFHLCGSEPYPDYSTIEVDDPRQELVKSNGESLNQASVKMMSSFGRLEQNEYFQVEGKISGQLNFFDLLGHKLYSQTLTNSSGLIMISHTFLPGLYLWSVADIESSHLLSGTIIISN